MRISNLCSALRELRDTGAMSRQEMADVLEVPYDTVWHWTRKLHAAYRELAGLKVLRRLLDSQEGATMKVKLRSLNTLLNGDD